MWSTFAATHQPITEDKSKSSSSGLTWSQRSPKEKIYLNITKVDFHTQIKMAIILPTGQWYAPSAIINDAWYCMVLQCIA